jgi:very-short-patch-repair endonuclease
LLFIDAGLPRPTTQIPVVENNGRLLRMLDMGWEQFMVAAEYDGDLHRTNRGKYVRDLRVLPKIERMGWQVIRVIKEDRDDDIIRCARTALISRGWRP